MSFALSVLNVYLELKSHFKGIPFSIRHLRSCYQAFISSTCGSTGLCLQGYILISVTEFLSSSNWHTN